MQDSLPKRRLVVLTALPAEYLAFRAHLSNLVEVTRPDLVYEQGQFADEEDFWDVCLLQTGRGNHASCLATERAVKALAPDFLFFVGVAGSLKDAQIGDVVVAEYVYPYASGKAGRAFSARPHALISTHHLVTRARSIACKPDWCLRIRGDAPASPPGVLIAPIASGDQVITSKNSEIYRILKKHFDDAQAAEMEGYGFLQTMKDYPHLGAIIIRGISDTLENKAEADEQRYQVLAARHASAFAVELAMSLRTFLKENVQDFAGNGEQSEKSAQEKREVGAALSEQSQLFFENLGAWGEKINEDFIPLLEREHIYREECSQALRALNGLSGHLQDRKNTFFAYAEVHLSLDNLSHRVKALKGKLQDLLRHCSPPRKASDKRGYKAVRDSVHQGCTDLLWRLGELQRQWERRQRK